MALQLALRAIEAYRSEKGLWDLFGNKEGVVAVTTIDGVNVFGSNSNSPVYTSVDYAAALELRDSLLKNIPNFLPRTLGKCQRTHYFTQKQRSC